MNTHLSNLVRLANFELRLISSIRHLLFIYATKIPISVLVLSRLDYCNSLPSGCPRYPLNKLQKVRTAARLVLRFPKTDHTSPRLASLHWLPFDSRIQYKLASLCYNSVSLTGPVYLTELLTAFIKTNPPASSDTSILYLPSVRTHSLGRSDQRHDTTRDLL